MRSFLALTLFALTIAASVCGQEPPKNIDLKTYVQSLKHYTSGLSERGSSTEVAQLIALANQDPLLAKSITIKGQTLSILREVQALKAAGQKNSEDQQQRDKERNEIYQASNGDSRNRTENKQKSTFRKLSQISEEQNKSLSALYRLKSSTEESVKKRIDAIANLASTPEGQQFSLSADSPFLAQLNPSIVKAPRPKGPLATRMYFEVATTTPEGFFGYRTKLQTETDQNGIEIPGSTKTDANGNYIHIADRPKNIFVRGYSQPATLGEMIYINVAMGEAKVINGIQVREYIFVPEEQAPPATNGAPTPHP